MQASARRSSLSLSCARALSRCDTRAYIARLCSVPPSPPAPPRRPPPRFTCPHRAKRPPSLLRALHGASSPSTSRRAYLFSLGRRSCPLHRNRCYSRIARDFSLRLATARVASYFLASSLGSLPPSSSPPLSRLFVRMVASCEFRAERREFLERG